MKKTYGPPSFEINKPLKKLEPAWMGIDSLHGHYLTGTRGYGPNNNEIPGGTIAPGKTVAIMERLQLLFKAERLFIKSTCAPSFLIRRVVRRRTMRELREHGARHR